MEKILKFGEDHEVKMKSSGAIPYMYRRLFNKDLFLGMDDLYRRMGGKKSAELNPDDLEMIERLAYCFAKHADPAGVPDDIETWLGTFEIMDIYDKFPEIIEMWEQDNVSTSKLKKKAGQ